jgi:MFS transporter, MHS family, proline/betaine transporter
MAVATDTATSAGPGAMRWAGVIGTIVEWYDYSLYVYLAPVIAGLFFPSDDPVTSLIATFAVLAAGYLIRPLGAAFFGYYGDTRGRKKALVLSVAMMAVPMVGIAVLPTNASIGAAAAVLLVVFRLIQGFSVGGEFSGSIVLLTESARQDRRGFTAAVVAAMGSVGVMLASVVALILNATLSTSQLDDFGWRLGFGVGAVIALVALAIRVRMPETPVFEEAEAESAPRTNPLREVLQHERRAFLRVFALSAYMALGYYLVAAWLPTYLQTFIGADASLALLATTLALLLHIVGCVATGALSDRTGRKPVLLSGAVSFAVLALPLLALVASPAFARMLVGMLALMIPVVLFTGPLMAAAAEQFPTQTRFSGAALSYSLGVSAFGGTAPLIATVLVQVTDWDLAPSLYLIAASLLIVPVVIRMRETYRMRLDAP